MFFVIPRSAATRNLPQFRRDSSDHKPADDFRLPYAPWQDLGVEVYGPVLRDMAQNFQESWRQMRMKGPAGAASISADRQWTKLKASMPWSTPEDEEAREDAEQRYQAYMEQEIGRDIADLTNEVYPEHLIGAALAAGLGKDAQVKDRKILNQYDVTSYKSLMKDGSLELSPPEEWNYRLAPQCLELCRYLTTLSMIYYGLMTGAFVGDGMLRPSELWDLSVPDAKKLEPPQEAAVKHTAQFFRTFPLLGMPKEVSIFQAYVNAIRKVQDGQLIYIENQYFRDEYITGELILRRKAAGSMYPAG